MRRRLASLVSFLHRYPFSTTTTNNNSILTPSELAEINSLILRLSSSGTDHIQHSIRLLSAALLAVPPSSYSLLLPSLPQLIDRLTSTGASSTSSIMYLLTTLRHHNPTSLPSCSSLLLSSFIRRNRLNEASKVLSWLLKQDNSACRPDKETYRVYVKGIWERNGRAVEAVRAVREMLRDGVQVGEEMRRWVWECLLREARVDEAKKLDDALAAAAAGGKAGELMDRMIKEWQDSD